MMLLVKLPNVSSQSIFQISCCVYAHVIPYNYLLGNSYYQI